MQIVDVLIEHGNYQLDQTFSYLNDTLDVSKGKRVFVMFNNRKVVAIVADVIDTDKTKDEVEADKGFKLNMILEVIDDQPLLNDELYELAQYLSTTTIAPLMSCLQVMLPSKMKPSSSFKAAKKDVFVKTNEIDLTVLTDRQFEVYQYIQSHEPISQTVVNKEFPGFVNRLEAKQAVSRFEEEASYQKKELQTKAFKTLTEDQKNAYNTILDTDEDVFLLHGVTGSGKTEVYLHLAQKMISRDKAVLFLVPEIALTPQMINHVQSRFGDEVAIYHSYLNDQEKYEQYQRVLRKDVKLVVGTRSSIFMPFEDIGLIIVDEEHDRSYKQESLPRYHARDVAIWRAKYHNAKVVLGSATPALESYARAIKSVYHLVELPRRISKHQEINYHIIDTSKSLKQHGQSSIFAEETLAAIFQRLQRHEQVVVLLNRRGYTPIFKCNDCHEVKKCHDCDVAMSFHKDDQMLVCHVCGSTQRLPVVCDDCGSTHFGWSGYGTQRVEDELVRLFKDVRVVRMDADQVGKKGSHERILNEFEHNGDILLGTQMIAKGLDFHKVTLVVVLNADATLARNSYRSVEDTFNLISQVSGRGGRGELASELYVQSFDPDHYAIVLACRNDYQNFFKHEMQYRHLAKYPPYTYLIRIELANRNEDILSKSTYHLQKMLEKNNAWQVLGPSNLVKIKKDYRNQFILRSRNCDKMVQELAIINREFQKVIGTSRITIDVNPMELE